MSTSFPSREIAACPGGLGRKLCWLTLCSSLQLRVSGTTSQGPQVYPDICLHMSLMSRIFPHFQHLSSSQDLCHLLSWPFFLLSGITSSFWEPLFLASSSFQNPKPWFTSLKSLCAGQHVINLLICDSVSCLFINWRIWGMPLLFSPSLIKTYNQPIPVTAIK